MTAATGGGKWADLGPRLISGGVAAAVGLWVMWLGGIPFHILIALVTGIMVWELVRMIGAPSKAVPLGIFAGLVMFAAVELPDGFALPLLMLPAVLGVSQLSENRFTYTIYTAAITVAGFGLVALRDDFGFGWMAWLALVVIVTDILGYFAGRFIGGPKFWPKVSPKKTWSGTVAGWIGAAMVGAFYVWQGEAGAELIGISIAVSMAGQIGDVAESALKRRMGVKDSSSIIPGHGGMFDRFDAMLGASLFLLVIEAVVDFPPVAVPL
ncbi:phosphatidate cytidylyltransferase [Alphaproteobacteria bacterium GH1-50]|uniref:Phosphatidate cytidylyltransferase n=1 Tax=Kangsaoukella pontilimi TaxID=2691042 RepID=A0A7C9MIT5_9RHOB|nr:phosphatidate cytidylyltransferase [Kangsaoukella pontilimi]MXQ07215.1 phosphatidate cytidylyltransferase [Kangsaoukella pontilimi]